MASIARSPRKSGLFVQDQNVAEQNVTQSPSKRRQSTTKPRSSKAADMVTTAINTAPGPPVAFQLGSAGNMGDLSPRRKARRSLKPRKSILKPNVFAREDDTTDFTVARGSMTENFGHLRRVSFASKAHVRMFQEPPAKSPRKRQSLPAPRGTVHSRRSSIQNLAAIQAPRFIAEGEAEGEASMEMDTASEQSDSSDDEAAVVSNNPDGSRRYSGQGAQFSLGGSAQVKHVEQADEDGEGESEGEMSMEVTQVIYGGLIAPEGDRRESMAGSEVSEGNSMASAGGEDQTMDFTIAVGGLMPHSPPEHGSKNARASIGYAAPSSPSSNGRFIPGLLADDEEVPMEETVAIGGIIGADDTMSSTSTGADDGGVRERTMTFAFNTEADEGDMDMTVAIGGIMPRQSTVHGNNQEDDDGMDMTVAIGGIIARDSTLHTGPRRSIPNSPFPNSTSTRGSTPSFARPTVSSATKSRPSTSGTAVKRNVFAPSPSPSPTKALTPRKSGMETAGEVAKRLSFGSNPGSSTRKRARSASGGETTLAGTTHGSPSKKRTLAENVFAPQSIEVQRAEVQMQMQVQYPVGGSSSTATPQKSQPGRLSVLPAKSPAKSPMLRRMLGQETQGAAEEVEQEGDFEPPTISLGSFLEMAGVQFIESLPGPRRRSSVGRGILGQSHNGEREFALHDYTAAQVNSVLLNMYSWAANRMKADITESATQLAQTETDCSVHNPPVIKEYLSAGDDEKKIFELTFKAFKTNTQLKARERWYDWKMDLMARVRPDVEEVLEQMMADNQRLDEMQSQADSLLPQLRAREAALREELIREREAVAELAECDQDELKEMREAINEQGAQVKAISSEFSESTTQLDKLETTLSDLQAKKTEALSAISVAKGMCDQFTKSDILRLQDEYKSLQALHLWRPIQMTPTSFTLTYDAEIQLSIECDGYTPDLRSAKVDLLSLDEGVKAGRALGYVWTDQGESPTKGLFRVFEAAVAELATRHSTSETSLFIQRVGQIWYAVQRLRQELRLIHVQYPMSFRSSPETPSIFQGTTSIMFPVSRSKAAIVFNVDEKLLLSWPGSVPNIQVEVEGVYGALDLDRMRKAIDDTMAIAAAEGYLGYLLQACVEVSSVC